jgi:hypothetical protein
VRSHCERTESAGWQCLHSGKAVGKMRIVEKMTKSEENLSTIYLSNHLLIVDYRLLTIKPSIERKIKNNIQIKLQARADTS